MLLHNSILHAHEKGEILNVKSLPADNCCWASWLEALFNMDMGTDHLKIYDQNNPALLYKKYDNKKDAHIAGQQSMAGSIRFSSPLHIKGLTGWNSVSIHSSFSYRGPPRIV